MIVANALCPCESVADQLDAMVLDALGAVNLLLPITGADVHLALAASAWCHEFHGHTPGSALLNLTHFGAGRVQVSFRRTAKGYEIGDVCAGVATHPDYRQFPVLLALADAEVVVCDGLDAACLAAPEELPGFLAACARFKTLTVAPVATANLMCHEALERYTVRTDALIAPDPVARQRSALLGAALMHRTQNGKEY
jgi:hypothetical protein